MQDHIGKQFRSDDELSVVVDESHFSEFIHEVSDARACRTDHFGESFVTQEGYPGARQCPVLLQSIQLQQNARQAFFTVIEELVAKVFFEADVARQKGCDELFVEPWLACKSSKHRLSFNAK